MKRSPKKKHAINPYLLRGTSIAAGCLLVLLTLEILLRFGALAVPRLPRLFGEDDAPLTVLCEGDSFTWGMGAKKSYPLQLEEILNPENEGGRFKVVNLGVPGKTSPMVLETLPEHLRRFRPDVVVLMIGQNNQFFDANLADPPLWKRSRLVEFVLRWGRESSSPEDETHYEPGSESEANKRIHRALESGRFEEARALWESGLETFSGSPDFALGILTLLVNRGLWGEAAELGEDAVRRYPKSEALAVAHGQNLISLERNEEALAFARTRASRFPRSEAFPEMSAVALHALGRVQQALELTSSALERFPESIPLWTARSHFLEESDLEERVEALAKIRALSPEARWPLQAILETYNRIGDVEAGERRLAKLGVPPDRIERLRRDMGLQGRRAKALPKWYLKRNGLHRDLKKINALVREHGARLILLSYPGHQVPGTLAAVREDRIPYIDLQAVFRKEYRSREEWETPDRHTDSAGYRLIARSVAPEIRRAVGLDD